MAARKLGRPPNPETVEQRQALAMLRRMKVRAKYDAAGSGRRLAGWNPPTQGPNRAIEGLQTIRNRARDVATNDWTGESSIQKWTTSLVGIGITPRFKRIKSKTRKQEIVDLWNDFVAASDADCVLNLYGQQTLAVRSWLDSGEVFARRRPRFLDEADLPVPMQVQLIEAEFVPLLDSDSYPGLPVGNRIRSGIEFNKRGRRVAYWIYKEHPGDGTGMMMMPDELVRVPASEIRHIFEQKRPGQLRGVSMLAPVLNRLKNIENYDDATLTRQQLANLVVGFITRGLPNIDEDDINALTNEENVVSGGTPLVGLQPGLMQELEDGQKVEWSNPPEAGTNYTDYMRTQHMGTSAAAGLPYELFAGDIKEISDRTLRVLIMEFRRFAEQRQWQIVIPMFCQPVVEWFAQAALLAGKITADEFDDVCRVEHAPHGWSHIHPVQDPQGKLLEVQGGFRSRSSVVGERGEDIDTVDDERQADDQREQDLGIGPYSAALQVPEPAPQDDPEEEDEDDQADQQPAGPSALDLALIARAHAETEALMAQAKRLSEQPEPPTVDPDSATRLALQERIVSLLEPASGPQ